MDIDSEYRRALRSYQMYGVVESYTGTRHCGSEYQKHVLDPLLDYIHLDSEAALFVDLGSGTGEYSQYLSTYYKNSSLNMYNLDLSLDALSVAGGIGVAADIRRLPLASNAISLLHSKDTLVHMPYAFEFLKQCYRVLQPGGYAIIVSAESDQSINCLAYDPHESGPNDPKEADECYDVVNKRKYRVIEEFFHNLFYEKRMQAEKNGKILSAPYFPVSESSVRESIQSCGFHVVQYFRWDQKSEKDWYDVEGIERFVFLLQKPL